VVKFYSPNLIFSDAMEGNLTTNWTVPNGGGPGSNWAFTNSSSYAGSYSLAESPSGNYSSNDDRIITYKNTFSLTSATGAYLSFWVKHRSENCSDNLQVQVSTNGTTWTPICGLNTVSESDGTLGGKPALTGIRENWTKEAFDLSAYLNSSSVQFRFVFTPDGDSKVDDGFYIDNVKLIKTSAVLTTLPVTFLHFSGKLLPDNTVKLAWEAYTDVQHDYFEVERSTDGASFTSIGRSSPRPPFNLVDRHPSTGVNYYRIRQVDKDGTVTYSKVVSISLSNSMTISIYPNPVEDLLRITASSTDLQRLTIQVTDIQGRQVYRSEKSVGGSVNEVVMDVKDWKKGLYILKVYDQNGQLQSLEKVIKH
jgi:hypothetical protein